VYRRSTRVEEYKGSKGLQAYMYNICTMGTEIVQGYRSTAAAGVVHGYRCIRLEGGGTGIQEVYRGKGIQQQYRDTGV